MTRLPRTVLSVLMILTAACSRVAAAPSAELSGSAGMGSAAGGSVLQESFFSEALGVRKALVVYLPPSYSRKTARRYPVAYYLHGLSGAQADWVSKGGIDAVADSLYANGTPEMILVMPDGDDGWYTTWVRQFSYRTCTDTLKVEAPDRYCVEHERYDDYV